MKLNYLFTKTKKLIRNFYFKFRLEEAEEKFRRKQLTTSYQFYHGGLSAPKNTSVNIF